MAYPEYGGDEYDAGYSHGYNDAMDLWPPYWTPEKVQTLINTAQKCVNRGAGYMVDLKELRKALAALEEKP